LTVWFTLLSILTNQNPGPGLQEGSRPQPQISQQGLQQESQQGSQQGLQQRSQRGSDDELRIVVESTPNPEQEGI
jgi:hypothetical protein